jgi:hypothetical protein
MFKTSRSLKNVLRTSTALLGLATASLLATPAQAIVGNDSYPTTNTTTLVDTTDITGVGQMVIDEGDGYVGLCTVSLINPRTVIFASHCVNDAAPTDYGSNTNGIPIGFGFKSYNRTGIINWLFNNDHETSITDAFYNASWVTYNEHSLDLGPSNNFLQADIALAALDTPAVGIPTWTLLFSPLTEATHATIVGYGTRGTGTAGGNTAIDFRRRVAENTISVLGSLDDVDLALFGPPLDGLPQNLYQLDFNDPLFDTAEANEYDFNIFHDAALQMEGITAPGDSGGPLVVDQLFNKSVIAAVLSGGSRYFTDQPSSSYGTTSFYQPLYLFWDWIVENNPYKYVSAKAGDGSWTDPNHWVINLDPNYVTIVDGELVNALPTTPAEGIPPVDGVNTPKFGQVCYYDDFCVDVATGEEIDDSTGEGNFSSQIEASPLRITLETLRQMAQEISAPPSASANSAVYRYRTLLEGRGYHSPTTGTLQGGTGLPVSGAPGTSGFIPDDTDGDWETAAPARYYDVTLSANGTTTLGGDNLIIIDRLTINGARTGLAIGPDAALASMIDTTMYAGNFRVDGLYLSIGDFALMGGVLSGNGAVVAPYTTAVLGAFAPGTVGTIGALELDGDVIMSSGSGLLIDMGQNNTTDFLDIYGDLSLGGTLVVTPVFGYAPKWHQSRVVLAADSITGSFNSVPDTITGVLYPTVHTVTLGDEEESYQEEVVTFEAASFSSLLTNMTQDQSNISSTLDTVRGAHYGDLQALYDAIDPLSDGALGSALENLAPDTARALPQVGQMLSQAYSGFMWGYLGGMSHSGEAQVAIQTDTLKLVQNSNTGSFRIRNLLNTLGTWDTGPATAGSLANPMPAEGGMMAMPKGMGGFLTGEAIMGSVAIGGGGGKANVDGYLVALGVDMPVSSSFRAGISVGFGAAKASLIQQPANTNTNMTQAVAYGQFDGDGYFINGFAGAGIQAIHTDRTVVVGSSTFHLTGHTSGMSPLFGVQLGRVMHYEGANILPAIGLQYARPNIDGYTETGGAPAMSISAFGKEEMDARLGFDANMRFDLSGVVLKPDLHAFYVLNLDNNKTTHMTAAFAAVPGSTMPFDIASTSKSWLELGIGTKVQLWEGADLGFRYNANPGRRDALFSAYSGSLEIKF